MESKKCMMKKLSFLLLGLLLLVSCLGDDDGKGEIICTDELVFGLRITVVDDTTSALLLEVNIQAADGDYTETLEESLDMPGVYFGAAERVGTYVLTLSREGYQSVTETDVIVAEDECHVIPETLTVRMAPN